MTGYLMFEVNVNGDGEESRRERRERKERRPDWVFFFFTWIMRRPLLQQKAIYI